MSESEKITFVLVYGIIVPLMKFGSRETEYPVTVVGLTISVRLRFGDFVDCSPLFIVKSGDNDPNKFFGIIMGIACPPP